MRSITLHLASYGVDRTVWLVLGGFAQREHAKFDTILTIISKEHVFLVANSDTALLWLSLSLGSLQKGCVFVAWNFLG